MSCSSCISSPTFHSSASSTSASSSTSDSSFSHFPVAQVPENVSCVLAIATLPERDLRALLAKLAAKQPTLERAIVHELLCHSSQSQLEKEGEISLKPKPLHRPAPPDVAVCANCQEVYVWRDTDVATAGGHCIFHPGHLEERVFEFLSRTPEGRPLTIRRTLAMWTCCAEDYQTLGCAEAKTHHWRAASW